MKPMTKVYHELEPIYNEKSKVLILGTMPSPKSREIGFYYGHPQNRFWKVLSLIFDVSFETKEEKIQFLLNKHIALWDVVSSCTIEGASDSTISDVVPNDIASLLDKTQISSIFTTGKKADALYQKYIYPKTHIKSICLPSTSPANCAVKEETLIEAYQSIVKYL